MIATLRQRNFTLLWLGGIISTTGDWLLNIGLPVYVYILTGSALATGIMLIIAFVPSFLLGSVAGVFVDRWDRRRTMIVSNLLLALGLLPLLFVHSKDTLWVLYVVLFFESCAEQFVAPAESALIPRLVGEELLVPANSLKSIGMNVSRLAGGALGGLLLGLLGLHSVALLDAVSFLFVCLMIWLIRMPAQVESVVEEVAPTTKPLSLTQPLKDLVHEWLEGLRLIGRQRALTILLIMFAIQSLGEGVFSVLLIVFVRQVLKGDALIYGSLMSLQAVGALAGGALLGFVGNRFAPARMLGVCAFLFGLIDLLIVDIPVFIPGVLIVMILFVLVGIPGTGVMVGLQTLLQSLVGNRLLGRIFGAAMSIGALMTLLGMALAGALGDRLGPVLLLNIQGGMYALSGLLVIFTLWGLRASKQRQELVESLDQGEHLKAVQEKL